MKKFIILPVEIESTEVVVNGLSISDMKEILEALELHLPQGLFYISLFKDNSYNIYMAGDDVRKDTLILSGEGAKID